MKIRVLLLVTDLELGGTPLAVKQLACNLDPSLFEVQVACLAGQGPLARELRKNNIATHCLGAGSSWDFWVLLRLARLVIRFRPHILHSFLVHANFVGRIVGKLLHVPCIIASLRTAEQGKKWHNMIENLTCRLSRITLCNSTSVFEHARSISHVPPGHLEIIVNGVDYSRFAHAQPVDKSSLGLHPEKTTLIFVGRLDPVKSLDVLLYALAQISPQQDLQLLIVGDGPQRSRLESLATQLNLKDRVYFCGFRRDVENLLAGGDIFIQPSRWEGCSNVVLEAMAAGIPVIASRTCGIVDLVVSNQTGLLFKPGDSNELGHAITTLIQNPAQASRLARTAQRHIKERFALEEVIKAYQQLYHSLL